MNEHHYQRIDKGTKRLKISEVEREARQEAKKRKGQFLPAFPPEVRSQAILEAIEGILHGWPLPKEVAAKHNIPQSTLYSWLIVEPKAVEARGLFFGERLGIHLTKIEEARDPLELARAREAYRAWADLASKRDPVNYGLKQEITHVTSDLGDRLRRARERVIDQADIQDVQALPLSGESPRDPIKSK